ncbi:MULTISPECIES: imidazole glycerol phosphate synthase subunit HisH [Acetobacter]|uniref:Imidazole glycerol phosphate synthase subunit HisH n=1 Tax=Acetobacter pomorum DM001 TaxID=945681 RepID=F1YRU9_9PROT|nr:MULTISPECIES: imidazole glycerol phosphate synthase subunit HisH [Acetobacter]ATI12320.1 imidazole glycerol phosphate synthase subunit HisH [Acetobacter pomorum]AXC27541.1 imidazole glycerol phosphate synthase subunit HisH [Acetobacter sp. JWB]EGE48539.1 Imidazole glycerol phosphate synthase subunit HisH [Acetobacter pomorum DM001]KAA8423935.1 imidazole glycerol phosphate synthase subunit HisH [Acetobacter pomorum]KAA8438362.1 imidazole glycerol phosphate synthase subunit HisH [Acetobacter 
MTQPLSIAVVDYEGGNLASAARAALRAAELSGIAADVVITNEPAAVLQADRIILPGQGAFADCARGLEAIPGLKDSILNATANGTPFLGICVGMQLMAERGREHGVTEGFGWIPGEITLMEATGLRLPQMGWNELELHTQHPLTHGLGKAPHGYFVHSYALQNTAADVLLATTDYGGNVPAIVCKGNVAGTQFHVEKSQTVGLKILANFLRWDPKAPV